MEMRWNGQTNELDTISREQQKADGALKRENDLDGLNSRVQNKAWTRTTVLFESQVTWLDGLLTSES